MYRGTDRLAAVVVHGERHGGGQLRAKGGQDFHHCIDHFDGVRTRLALDRQHDAARAMDPACDLVVLDTVGHRADVAEAHRRAVAPGDDLAAEGVGVGELSFGADDGRAGRAVERACRVVDVGGARRRRYFIDAKAAGGQRVGIELDADCIFL